MGTYPIEAVIARQLCMLIMGFVAFCPMIRVGPAIWLLREIDGVVRQSLNGYTILTLKMNLRALWMNDGALTYPNYRDNPSTPISKKAFSLMDAQTAMTMRLLPQHGT